MHVEFLRSSRGLRSIRGTRVIVWLVGVALVGVLAASPRARAGGEPPDPVRLARELAAAVDLSTPSARAAAADLLAARDDVPIDAWLTAAKLFVPAGAAPVSGAGTESADLTVLEAKEPTSIATYVPTSRPDAGRMGLLLAFHGQGGRGVEVSSAWTAAAQASHLLVVAPTEAGPNEGYRFSARERAAALAALRWARRRFDVDENRVYLTGWSRGGHLTWDVALHHPDQFAAVIPIVGSPRLANQSAENNLRYLEGLVDVSIRDLQGSKDDPKALWNIRFAFERLDAWKARDAKLIEFPDRGHDADLSAVDWTAFFAMTARDPHRKRVIRSSAAPGEGRSLWAEILTTDATVALLVAPREPSNWATLDDAAKRKFIEAAVEKKTARLEVKLASPNRFEAKSTGVTTWRLLLDADLVDASKPVTVVWNGKASTKPVVRSKAVLLREFVERFDRSFLPVVEISTP